MKDHRIQFRAEISELGSDGLSMGIPDSVYSEIKASDPNPFWVKFEIGREGTSSGSLQGFGKKVKRWTSIAIKELAQKIMGGDIFTDKHGDPADKSRPTFGRIVHTMYEEVEGKTIAFALAYIKDEATRNRIKSKELNVCSIEAIASVVQSATEFIVDGVERATGLVIANGKSDRPGFSSAGILTSVQELEGEDDEMTIRKSDVIAWIIDNKVSPCDIFGADIIAKDPTVIGIVSSSMDEKDEEHNKELKTLQEEHEKLSDEIKPYKAEALQKRLKGLITENALIKALPKNQAEVIIEMVTESIGDSSSKSDADIAAALEKNITATIDRAKKLQGSSSDAHVAGVPAPGGGEKNEYAADQDTK